MSKTKQIIFTIVISLLAVVVIVDTIMIYSLGVTVNNMVENPESYIPQLATTNTFVKIDDVGFLPYEVVRPDPKKVESGDLKVYTAEEVNKMINDAAAKRDGQTNAE